MKRNMRARWTVFLAVTAAIPVHAGDNQAAPGESAGLQVAPCPETVPVNLYGAAVGARGVLQFELPPDVSAYQEAVLLLHVDDVDAPQEADMFVNDEGPLTWPASVIGEGEHGGAMVVGLHHLRPGRNHFQFVFRDNLGNTTQGFRVLEAELDLFRHRSPARLARLIRESATWGRPVDWCRPEALVRARGAPPSREQEAATISDFFQDEPLARWTGIGGTWKKTTDEIQIYDVDEGDLYVSPEEPGWVEWVGLWKEKDGAIRVCFAHLTGNPGLEPSYRPWYGRGSKEAWMAFTKQHQMRLGPEDAVASTHLEYLTLRTRDQGDTWENLGPDQEPSGSNLRFVLAADGTLVNNGVATVRCRDGRLVSTVWPHEWQPGCLLAVRESLDDGKTWSPNQFITPEGGDEQILKTCSEENALVELDDGRILALIRTDPGGPCQTYLTRSGPGEYKATPPVWTPIPHSGLPEIVRGSDGVIWFWGIQGVWYTADDGQTWQAAAVKFPSYYGKMIEAAPHRILGVTQNLIGDSPYPYWYDATVRQYRLSYRRSGIMEQTDAEASGALCQRKEAALGDLHLRADVRIEGANGLAFRLQPDGQSYYFLAVVQPDAEAYQQWFPQDVPTDPLTVDYPSEDPWLIAQGDPICVIGRVDNGQVNILRGIRLAYIPRGSWLRMQVKVTGDLLQGAVNSGPTPIYVGARDATYPSGGVGLFTHSSPGAFKNFQAWSRPQMIRDRWQ